MEAHSPKPQRPEAFAPWPCVARYSAVFWEPLSGTGERVVAMLAIEPHESTVQAVSPGTYVVLRPERLRAMLGRQRGSAAQGVLREAAAFMTSQQRAGLPLSDLKSPFYGFLVGPSSVARGLTVEQLLDAAVRSVSVFGSADEMIDEEESQAAPRHTVRTTAFLGHLKRLLSANDDSIKSRFDKHLRLPGDTPEVTIDYAFESWLVQVTSLPTSVRQSVNAQREAQSKLLELEIARRAMDGNVVSPVLLVNEDSLQGASSEEAVNQALSMQERLIQLARSFDTQLLQAPSAERGVQLILELHDARRPQLAFLR